MTKLDKGFVHIYTGNGKGKTTAAIGQAVRAAGAGLKSYILQFMKEYPYNELNSLKHLSEWITIEQICNDDFVLKHEPAPQEQIEKAKLGIDTAKKNMLSGIYDLVILDEVCVAIYFGLLTVDDVIPLMKVKPRNVELILTGRYCPQVLIDYGDLVTEMKEIKHYHQKGVLARKGIDS